MAINFPASPTDGQTYTENGVKWKYNSAYTAWLVVDTPILANTSSGQVLYNYNDTIVSSNGISFSTEANTLYVNGMNVSSTLIVDGNVGIGTSSPGASLEVSGGATNGLLRIGQLQFKDNSGSHISGTNGVHMFPFTDGMLYLDNYDGGFSFRTLSSSEKMRITSAGNVGIGTSSPSYLLSVENSSTDANYYAGRFYSGANPANTSITHIRIEKGNGYGGTVGGYINQGVGSGLVFSTLNGGTVNNVVWVNSSGNVGIGTSSPAYPLTIYPGTNPYPSNIFLQPSGDATSNRAGIAVDDWIILQDIDGSGTKNFSMYQASTAQHRLFINTSGNVGIGTTSPGAKLNVLTDTAVTPYAQTWDIFNNGTFQFANILGGDSTNGCYFGPYQSVPLRLITNNTERLRITSNGNIGIGTSSPSYKLDVNGTFRASGIADFFSGTVGSQHSPQQWGWNNNVPRWKPVLEANADLTFYRYDSSGNYLSAVLNMSNSTGRVGIGTTGPGYQLQVVPLDSATGAIYGQASAYIGVAGTSSTYYGVYGESTNNYGMYGKTGSSSYGGVLGYNYNSSRYALLGYSTNYAIYGSGDAYFSGSLSKGSGSFKIPHPLPELSETHNLVHSFVEAPTADNIYRGKVQLENGQATVNIDTHVGMTEGTFSALNGNIQVFLQNDSGWDLVRGSVSDNILTIISQNQSSTDTISWMVIGERQDQHMLDTQWTDEFGRPILEPVREPEPDIPLPEVSNENG